MKRGIKRIITREEVMAGTVDMSKHKVCVLLPNGDWMSLNASGHDFMQWFVDYFCPEYIEEHKGEK